MSNRESAASEVIEEHNEEELKNRAINSGRYAYTPVITAGGFTLGIACENIRGYYKTNYHSVPTYKEASEWANAINDKRLTRQDATKIVLSSMAPTKPKRRSVKTETDREQDVNDLIEVIWPRLDAGESRSDIESDIENVFAAYTPRGAR